MRIHEIDYQHCRIGQRIVNTFQYQSILTRVVEISETGKQIENVLILLLKRFAHVVYEKSQVGIRISFSFFNAVGRKITARNLQTVSRQSSGMSSGSTSQIQNTGSLLRLQC
ncbi:hypothetical protein D3C80_1773000 [compost metagenome]